MSVIWCTTDPDSGHSIRASEADQLVDELAELRDRGRGYVEISVSELDKFQLAVGFQADYAVIHLFDDEERAFLLVGEREGRTASHRRIVRGLVMSAAHASRLSRSQT